MAKSSLPAETALTTFIRTVGGDITPAELGFCHSHEHLFLADGAPRRLNPDLWFDEYGKSLQELSDYKAIGGSAIVDAQPLGCGRMERELVAVSQAAGVHVIASTGFHKLAMYSPQHWIHRASEEELSSLFISELTAGMYTGTDQGAELPLDGQISARAGQIKTAVDDERMADPNKRWFAAAARASLATGAPIMCHTESLAQARWMAAYYRACGVPAERVILCHLDRRLEQREAHLALVSEGFYLEYDTIGRFKYHSDEAEATWIAAMLAEGAASRLLLGLDTTRARLRAYGGEIGLCHLRERFLPLLAAAGATADQLLRLMELNPAQAFAWRTSR